MKIKLASRAGFCMGVKRAMDIVLNMAEENKETIYTYGPLIHNPQVIELLRDKGIKDIDNISGLKTGTPIVIRTHGITPQKRREIKDKGLTIKDATCPLVMKVQSIIKKYAHNGYGIVIVGDEGHAEVEGLMGFSEGKGVIINSEKEIFSLPLMDKVCVVAQTTLNNKHFEKISNIISERYASCEVFNTICDATEKRQSEAIDICKTVDAMVIVGGRNSANTNRLATVCSEAGTPTFLVETEDELDDKGLVKYETIGITAGASTPNWMIRRVVEKLEKIEDSPLKWTKNFIEFMVESDIYRAIGGGFITYGACVMQGVTARPSYVIISTMYLFAMYVLNNFTDKEAIKISSPNKTRFLEKNKDAFIASGTAALIFSIIVSAGLGIIPFILLILSSALGVFYSIKVIPDRFLNIIRYKRLKEIPGSKDIFVSLAWIVVTVLIPFYGSRRSTGWSSANIIAVFFIFTIVYIRSLISDIKEIEGDRLVGRNTIPIIIGKERTKQLIAAIAFITALILITSAFTSMLSSIGFFLLLSISYICGYLYLFHRRVISEGIAFDLVVDGSFVFTGVVAIIWKYVQIR